MACSHGTNDLGGRQAISSILADVRAHRPDLAVHDTYVDVQQPQLAEVLAAVLARTSAVVVPMLLSGGYHVKVDIAEAVTSASAALGPVVAGAQPAVGAGRSAAVAAPPLGPDPRIVAVLRERLAEAGVRDDDWVVLAAAGSSDPGAARDVAQVAAALRSTRTGPVVCGYGSMARPSVREAVDQARSAQTIPGRAVAVASYLLAPGFFYDRVLESGADAVTAPLAPHPALARIVLDRYDAMQG
ncbi:Sirohydrochlorin ferrochelatase [Sanguibacter gelidistatuariae]|uniref:Sirohydrochlorin ferrochelatase n=1 Tax=Sanguibacter gelidistatuariae TaxID=1814289 RepID=A0A1G6HCG0_9MICO|nr:Sirohydrochlorin ferrochelatase [Sanguibacter gelidistatuariae]